MYTESLSKSFFEIWKTFTPSFVSFYFILFVFALVVIYYITPKKVQWGVLLVGSVVFYSVAGMHPLITILLTSLLVYFSAILIESVDKKYRRKRRIILTISILTILAVLVWGKVYNLFKLDVNYIVPLGISYYTFSAIGYLADVYWGKEKAEKNYFKFALFLLYFPKIIQGPISKHRQLGLQLVEGHQFDYKEFCFGIQLAMWGYFKKIVIADRISLFINTVFADAESFGGAILIIAAMLGSVQLYADFSGCMDIAAGISQMLGIKLERNFNHPFFARNASEFWRRWHVTLGVWFKDYVYMPIVSSHQIIKLCGNIGKKVNKRFGKAMLMIIPTTIVWILTGLWHGTGTNYVVWGIYWGFIIIVSTVFTPEIKKIKKKLAIDDNTQGWKNFQIIRTFFIFTGGRLITIPNDLQVTGKLMVKIFSDWKLWQLTDGTPIIISININSFTSNPCA